MDEAAIKTAVRDAIQAGFEEDQKKKFDPFRNAIVFLAGLLAFCVSIIIGIFSILPDYADWKQHTAVAPMIGGVLIWISLATLAATVGMAIVQVRKAIHSRAIAIGGKATRRHRWGQIVLMALPVALGTVAVYYCVRGGAAIMDPTLIAADGRLPPILAALCALF